jgi:hypothetical protein
MITNLIGHLFLMKQQQTLENDRGLLSISQKVF